MICREEMERAHVRIGRAKHVPHVVCLASEPVFWPGFDFASEAL